MSRNDEKNRRRSKKKEKAETPSKPVKDKTVKLAKIEPRSKNQSDYLESFENNAVTFGIGPAGTGKSLRNSEIVYTSIGPVKNGDLIVGDYVCTPDGSSTEILAIYPQGRLNIYRVTFSDGSTVDCSEDHLWVVEDKQKTHIKYKGRSPNRQVNTQFLKEKIEQCSRGHERFSIKTSEPVDFQYIPYDIDPYVLGVLIGDGSISTNSLSISIADGQILQEVGSILGSSYSFPKRYREYDYGITYNENGINPLTDSLRKYHLLGKISNNKSIPQDYLLNSKEVRLAVLQGLMDTDGTVDKNSGMPSFCTVSKQLAKDVKFLVESLGGIVNISEKKSTYTYNGQRKIGQLAYNCWIRYNNTKDLFRLKRKKDLAKNRTKYLTKRIIRKIEKIGKDYCTCIYIDHPDHLYLTNHFIATHNTFLACFAAAQWLAEGKIRRVVLVRPVVEAGEKIGYLPGDIDDKLKPYIQPLEDALNDMIGVTKTKEYFKDKIIQVIPLAYMRGRTLNNSFVILDEAQNTDSTQMKMFLTRMGNGSKFVINGDTTQTDIEGESGLIDVQKRLKGLPGVKFIYFSANDIVRHHVVQKIVEAYEFR